MSSANIRNGILNGLQPRQVAYIFRDFIRLEASGGILLILFTALALVWANSQWSDAYFELWQAKFTIGLGSWVLSKPLLLWINDGLMALFFFVVGLEIKREVLAGELSSPSRAALPLVAAIGGMAAPAIIYTLFNIGTDGTVGWGIPMATDIAFTLGALALLGSRVPLALKVFVTAVAIVDDIGAVLVIALFYTENIAFNSLAIGGGILLALIAFNRLHVHQTWPYALLGISLWLAFLFSGVHATIAGVLLAMTIPASMRVDEEAFMDEVRDDLAALEQAHAQLHVVTNRAERQAAVQALSDSSYKVETPLQRFEHTLHPWTTYVILPLFAFANAGVTLSGGGFANVLQSRVALGIIAGLIAGKSVGVSLFSWLAVRLGIAELPSNLSWYQVLGVSFLTGIGFTMSLFISTLAFGQGDLLSVAKLGIITGSVIAGIVGWTVLRLTPTQTETAQSLPEDAAAGD
jgi:NhaA family Na+:H+ antiporter